jgi:hypothetical protein
MKSKCGAGIAATQFDQPRQADYLWEVEMGKIIDITGKRYGRLVALRENPGNQKQWICKCDCGNTHIVTKGHLKDGHVKSCGCLLKEGASHPTHGLSQTRIYSVWHQMIYRCENPKSISYPYYGSRGITVCDEWHDVKLFNKWAMANGYEDKLTIDRIDSDGNYEPSNCRWKTIIEQNNNLRSNHVITINGQSKTMAMWSKEYGIKQSAIYERLQHGWSEKDAISMPVNKGIKYKNRRSNNEN